MSMLNVLNCVHYLKIVYVECIELCTFLKKKKKKFECWIYKIEYIIWKMCKINVYNYVYYLKIVYVKCTKLCTFIEK